MTILSQGITQTDLVFPDSDGKPMADNTLQFEWIVTIKGNLDAHYADDPNTLVVGDLLWYPDSTNPRISAAPDTMVVFGRPRGYRGSYKQWEEGGVAPQVVFEILSPNNRPAEMHEKFLFYQRHGVEEYYLFDPDHIILEGWLRLGNQLVAIPNMQGHVSPRLKIRFDLSSGDLVIYHANGKRFTTFTELVTQRDLAEQAARKAEAGERAAREERDRLAAQLRALGIEPEA
jgi:Uma2 family endonuclease